MDLSLSGEQCGLQARARRFFDEVLAPVEWELEDQSVLPATTLASLRTAVVDHGLNAINQPTEYGGQGLPILDQILVNEQLGRATNGLWAVVWHPAFPLKFGTRDQTERYLIPSCSGERRGCFAITERDAGSDPTRVTTRADRVGGGFVLNGEKWFVTSGDIADYIIVHAHVDGDPDKATLFLVDKDMPGVVEAGHPKFTHTYVFGHPEIHFRDVRLEAAQMLGEVGQGFEMTKEWFVEARLQIAANCVGAATRATEIAHDFARRREQFGRLIYDFQAVEHMLADNAVEIMAAKSMLYRVAAEIDAGVDRKQLHARASAVKLYGSEMAGRVLDRAVQVMGGRGYMRDNPVERLNRDVRVDRIWEGTSEIQRSIIGRQLRKRGVEIYTGWTGASGDSA